MRVSISSNFSSVTDLRGRILGLQSTCRQTKLPLKDKQPSCWLVLTFCQLVPTGAPEQGLPTSESCPFSETSSPDLGSTSCKRAPRCGCMATMQKYSSQVQETSKLARIAAAAAACLDSAPCGRGFNTVYAGATPCCAQEKTLASTLLQLAAALDHYTSATDIARPTHHLRPRTLVATQIRRAVACFRPHSNNTRLSCMWR